MISKGLEGERYIPKIIHYCWFGGKPLPALAVKCIESWKKFCPDYEIKEWNESNFDINICEYVKNAYDEKKWAFVTDYVRLYALVNQGGVYMDTDVEVVKNIDDFLQYHAFSGFEGDVDISTGIMACEKGFSLFAKLLNEYHSRQFYLKNGKADLTTNVEIITNQLIPLGLCRDNTRQNICGLELFPKDYFCPKSHKNGIITLTDNTYTIHHFQGSWMPKDEHLLNKLLCFFSGHGIVVEKVGIMISLPVFVEIKFKKLGVKKALKFYIDKYILRR